MCNEDFVCDRATHVAQFVCVCARARNLFLSLFHTHTHIHTHTLSLSLSFSLARSLALSRLFALQHLAHRARTLEISAAAQPPRPPSSMDG